MFNLCFVFSADSADEDVCAYGVVVHQMNKKLAQLEEQNVLSFFFLFILTFSFGVTLSFSYLFSSF